MTTCQGRKIKYNFLRLTVPRARARIYLLAHPQNFHQNSDRPRLMFDICVSGASGSQLKGMTIVMMAAPSSMIDASLCYTCVQRQITPLMLMMKMVRNHRRNFVLPESQQNLIS